MSISKKKHRWQLILYSKFTLAFLIFCCILLALSVYERFSIAREMTERRQEREQEYNELKDRQVQLEEKVDYLEGEHGVESELRRNFNVAKEGEEVVIIVDDESESTDVATNATSTKLEEKEGFWSKWFPW